MASKVPRHDDPVKRRFGALLGWRVQKITPNMARSAGAAPTGKPATDVLLLMGSRLLGMQLGHGFENRQIRL